MNKLILHERNWHLVHKLEGKEKAEFLKKLTVSESFAIFSALYSLAYAQKKASGSIFKLDSTRLNMLVNFHKRLRPLIR